MEDDKKSREELLAELRELREHHAAMEEHIEGRTAELRASQKRLSIVLEGLPAFVYLLGRDYEIRYANRRFVEVFGEVESTRCYEVTAGRDRPCEPCPTFRIFDEDGPPEWEWTDPKDGRVYRILAYRMPDEEGVPLILELGIDITERRTAEDRLHAILENVTDGLVLIDIESRRFETWNPAFCGMLGYSDGELRSLTFLDLLPPSNKKQALTMFGEASSEGRLEAMDVGLRRKDGTTLVADASATVVELAGRTFLLCTIRDVTERRNLEKQLQAAQRLEAIGRLAGGIAHDFNNILAVIKSFGGFVDEELDERDPARSDVKEILNAAERANQLTRQLLAFSQRQVVQP